ncbi:MAG: glycine cleavage system aminomethyltransferase GcvT, partial [Bacteroidales bacterium]
MKTTVFTNYHIALGAKMVPFAGYNMPVQYEGLIAEHLNVREKIGVFDVSHMGEFWVKGPKAFAFVQHLTTNDVAALSEGKVQYSCFPNGRGGIVDDLLVYCVNHETYLLVINAANIDKDWAWCSQHAKEMGLEVGKELYNASEEIAQLAVQGPLALKAMQKLTSTPVEDMEYYTFKKLDFAGVKDVIFSTTGYTGAGGCEIYMSNADAPKIWKAVFEAGAEFGIKPAGLGARDTLRLEMGFCLYGHEITDETS